MSLTTSNNVDIVTNHDNTRTELHVTGYTTEMYGGSYELLVTSPPGRTVVATWTVEEAGESWECVYTVVCNDKGLRFKSHILMYSSTPKLLLTHVLLMKLCADTG